MKLTEIQWAWTVPNGLSLLRILILPVFALLYLNSGDDPALLWWAAGVLVVSGLSDLFDGLIARRFGQVSEIGKLLDPLADKLTQLTVVICLATRYRELIALMVLCLAKEAAQVVGGLLLLRREETVRGSLWFGKLATFVFYGAMAAIVLFPTMPGRLLIGLVVLVALFMLLAFFGYLKAYIGVRRALRPGASDTDIS